MSLPQIVQRTCQQCGQGYEIAERRSRGRKYCGAKCLTASKKPARDIWYEKNHERQRARQKQYAEAHREEARQRANKRYAEMRATDPDAVRKYWQDQNSRARVQVPWTRAVSPARNRAKEKGLPFDLTIEWAKARWTGKCEITGLPFDLITKGHGPRAFSPSIDRIKPELGYIQSNCRFVIHAVNALKSTGTDADMLRIAEAIVRALTNNVKV